MNTTKMANNVTRSILAESEKQKKYQEYFDKKLKKWDVSSPAELSDEDKKKFFEEVDKGWTSDKE